MKKSPGHRKSSTARTSVHVVPKAGGWSIRKSGSDRLTKLYTTQKEAVQAARVLAQTGGGGDVTLHRRDGRIREVDTYSMGSRAFGKVSAIEGVYLTKEMKRVFQSLDRLNLSPAERRRRLIAKYSK